MLLLLASPAAWSLPREARVPGGVALLPLGPANGAASAQAPRAWLGAQPVLVTQEKGRWLAVVGLPLELEPGPQQLRVDDDQGVRDLAFTLQSKRYPEQRITLKDTGKVQLSPENERRALSEIELIRELKKHWQAAPTTDLDFQRPADGRLSSRFGLRRIFNGEPRAPHVGLDIAIPRGTPVASAARGRVLATGDYFFNGKTVFVDHGNGLISMYCHLDRITVAPGELLARGQQLGLSGASGRASGPHLHWSVILNGAMVDPELFLPAGR